MTIALELMARVRGTLSKSAEGQSPSAAILESLLVNLTDGTGANQANALYIDEFSIAASGTLDIDLAGALTDILGQATVFSAVKAVLLVADAANVNNVVYGNGTNPFVGPLSSGAATFTALPGGGFIWINPSAAGWPVVAGTGDIVRLANSGAGTPVTGTIAIVGEA
jgi:hypothetical protein